jgi:hypothetical protein
MTLLDQLARLFLEPQASVATPERDVRWLPPGEPAASLEPSSSLGRVAVVCAPRDARLAGGAVALAFPPPALILEWTGEEGVVPQDRPCSPGARRGATLLGKRGLVAATAGRVVRVGLPATEDEAAETARGILRQSEDATVLVVAGPRGPTMEDVLAGHDRILLAIRPGVDAEMTGLALAALERLAPSVALELPSSPAAAALARSGTALVSPLRTPCLAALGAQR